MLLDEIKSNLKTVFRVALRLHLNDFIMFSIINKGDIMKNTNDQSFLPKWITLLFILGFKLSVNAAEYKSIPPSDIDFITNVKKSISIKGGVRFSPIRPDKYMIGAIAYFFDVPMNNQSMIELLYSNYTEGNSLLASICVPKNKSPNQNPEDQEGLTCFEQQVKLETLASEGTQKIVLYNNSSTLKLSPGYHSIRLIINKPVEILGLRLKYEGPESSPYSSPN